MPNQAVEEPVPCARLAAAPVSSQDASALARAFKALGDPVRLQLLSLIAAQDGEICVCDLTAPFEVTAPTISHHLKVLREAGLISSQRRGTWVYYHSEPAALARLSDVLAQEQQALR